MPSCLARRFVDEVWPSNQCDRIKDLNIFLPKVANTMKTIHLIVNDDFMLLIEGRDFILQDIFVEFVFPSGPIFRDKRLSFSWPCLDWNKFWGNSKMADGATWSLIKSKFRSKTIPRDCYRQMTGKVMSLIAYGAFTDNMVISNPTSHDNIDHMFWKNVVNAHSWFCDSTTCKCCNRCQYEYASHLYIVARCRQLPKCTSGATFWIPAFRTGSQWRRKVPSLGIEFVPRLWWLLHKCLGSGMVSRSSLS